jgi:hypothetical protein
MKNPIMEFLFPWLRIRRIERELDAEEKIGVARMKLEWWDRQEKETLREFHRPMLFKKFL